MAARTQMPDSLDDLLSANRQQFDSMFERQMSGGSSSIDNRVREASSTRESDSTRGKVVHDNESDKLALFDEQAAHVIAQLNRQFMFGWSTKVLDQQVRDGRAVVRCEMTVGDRTETQTGSAAVDNAAEQTLAMSRATTDALRRCAALFEGDAPGARITPSAGRTAGRQSTLPLDWITANRVEASLAAVCLQVEQAAQLRAISNHLQPLGHIASAAGERLVGYGGFSLSHMIDAHRLTFQPGDVLICNDPYQSDGAVSNTDEWLVCAPAWTDSDLIGYVVVTARLCESAFCGQANRSADARSIFDEGMRIGPQKIVASGQLHEPTLQLIAVNSQQGDRLRADLVALITAVQSGASQLARVCERFGAELFHRAGVRLLERSDQVVRDAITKSISQEPQSFEDQIDGDGHGQGALRLKLTAWREQDHVYLDWTGTAAQANGPVNRPMNIGLMKYLVADQLLPADAAPAAGFYDAVHIRLAKGSMLNPDTTAPIGFSDHLLARVRELTAQAMGGKPQAASYGSRPMLRFDADGNTLTDWVGGGTAGRFDRDGLDGASIWPEEKHMSVEAIEDTGLVIVERCASVIDSGGAGQFRGGNGLEKVFRFLRAGTVGLHDDRHDSTPPGVQGGHGGAHSEKWIVRADSGPEPVPSKISALAVQAGDRIIFKTAGGGGWGDPWQRDRAAVQRDVIAGLVSVAAAASEYGVVVRESDLSIDEDASGELRSNRR